MERPEENNAGSKGMRLQSLLLQTLSDDPHLTDSELIELGAGVINADEAARLRRHARSCPDCAAEIERLSGQAAAWQDPWEIERREARIGRSRAMQKKTAAWPWWAAAAIWAPVAPLRPRLGALAEGDDGAVVSFSITDGREIVIDLSGIVQRRGNEYQVRITPSPEAGELYNDREVEIMLAGESADDILLQRRVPIGRFVLIGTDLVVSTEKIAARLLP